MQAFPTELPLASRDALWIVDLCSMARVFFHAAQEKAAANGEPTHATAATMSLFVRMLRHDVPFVAAAIDRENALTWRHAIWSGYQAGRAPWPPGFAVQLARIAQLLRLHAIPIYDPDDCDADDAIATATRIARGLGLQVVIISRDLDLAQLVDGGTWLWNGAVGASAKVYTPLLVEKEFGVSPCLLGDLYALSGDRSDGIPGIDGVGDTTAAEWLKRFGSLENVLRLGPSWLSPSKRRTKLAAGTENVRLWRTLVDLRTTAPIGFDARAIGVGGYNVSKLREMYYQLGFGEDRATRGWMDVAFVPKPPERWTFEEVDAVIKGAQR